MTSKLKYHPPRRMPALSMGILIAVAVVLFLLAVLQYRWITQVSEAEQNRLKENLATATARFAEDFDRELMPLLGPTRRPGQPGPPRFNEFENDAERIARRYDQWISTSRNPELLRDLFVTKPLAQGELQLFRFNPETRALDAVDWPEDLAPVRDRAAGRNTDRINLEHIPAFITPVLAFRYPGPPPPDFRGGPQRMDFPSFVALEIIRLDKRVFAGAFLPFLVQRHFAKQGDSDYDIMIVRSASDDVIYKSSPDLALSDFRQNRDAAVRLGPGEGGRAQRGGPPLFGSRGWQLYAKHHMGSIQSFAEQFRRRNLLMSFGIFALLASGIAFTFWSSERVRAVGKMQLEFAAGLSHELRTPLAVIRSAGYNLASGNISGKEDVARYGKVLQEQGLRLSDMVEQALLFAQTQSGRNRYERSAVDVKDVIEKAIDACRGVLPAHPSEIVAELAPTLPLAMTDANALGHCLHNLLMNALKYGSTAESVCVTARSAQRNGKSEIEIAIHNNGVAIASADLPHIFEPFFRGSNTGGIAGSGLGLYIVRSIMESLGGRVSVTSSADSGTRFTLHIPAAA